MDDDFEHDDDCGMDEAMPWVALAVGGMIGLTATSGWIVLTAWKVLGSVHARQVAGL